MAAPTSPDNNLDQFFADLAAFVAGAQTPAQKAAALLQFFCPDSAGPPVIPAVGITNHGPQIPVHDPYFKGRKEVSDLWTQFYTSFQNFSFAPTTLELPGGNVAAPRLKATVTAGVNQIPMIAVQCDLSGTFQSPWNPPNHLSLPLSGIPVGHLFTNIAAAAVFAFDIHHLITRMWIYMDRYKLQNDLFPGSSAVLAGFAKGLEHWEKTVAEASAKHGKEK